MLFSSWWSWWRCFHHVVVRGAHCDRDRFSCWTLVFFCFRQIIVGDIMSPRERGKFIQAMITSVCRFRGSGTAHWKSVSVFVSFEYSCDVADASLRNFDPLPVSVIVFRDDFRFPRYSVAMAMIFNVGLLDFSIPSLCGFSCRSWRLLSLCYMFFFPLCRSIYQFGALSYIRVSFRCKSIRSSCRWDIIWIRLARFSSPPSLRSLSASFVGRHTIRLVWVILMAVLWFFVLLSFLLSPALIFDRSFSFYILVLVLFLAVPSAFICLPVFILFFRPILQERSHWDCFVGRVGVPARRLHRVGVVPGMTEIDFFFVSVCVFCLWWPSISFLSLHFPFVFPLSITLLSLFSFPFVFSSVFSLFHSSPFVCSNIGTTPGWPSWPSSGNVPHGNDKSSFFLSHHSAPFVHLSSAFHYSFVLVLSLLLSFLSFDHSFISLHYSFLPVSWSLLIHSCPFLFRVPLLIFRFIWRAVRAPLRPWQACKSFRSSWEWSWPPWPLYANW